MGQGYGVWSSLLGGCDLWNIQRDSFIIADSTDHLYAPPQGNHENIIWLPRSLQLQFLHQIWLRMRLTQVALQPH